MSRLLVPAVVIAVLLGCARDDTFSGSFVSPGAVAVLDPSMGGPFTRPLVYAADQHGGRIRVLDPGLGLYAADDPIATFWRGAGLAAGRERIIADVAPWAPDDATAYVLVADRRFDQLVRLTHVDGVAGGAPVEPTPEVIEALFFDVDGSGEEVTIEVELQAGAVTSETWTFTQTGDGGWEVVGDRSGRQQNRVFPGVPWSSDDQGVRAVLRGVGTPGDLLTVAVEGHAVELDLPATPIALRTSPDGQRVAVALADRLGWLDPGAMSFTDVPLPAGASPGRMAWSPDGASVYVVDQALPALWQLDVGGGVIQHDLPWPVSDVAVLDREGGARAFVARADAAEVWVLDLPAGVWLDVNLTTPEVDGMRFLTPVMGLDAIPESYEQAALDDDGERREGRSVAVTLQSGATVWLDEATGCGLPDIQGPRTNADNQLSLQADYQASFEVDELVRPWLESIADQRRHVLVNGCAGIAWSERWTLRFDGVAQGWEVEGVLSGRQAGLAREDTRYVSDRGQVSFVMRAGNEPTPDGAVVSFTVVDGLLSANGDNDRDGAPDVPVEMPGDPVVAVATDETGARVPWVVAASQASDIVVRIDPRTARIERIWK